MAEKAPTQTVNYIPETDPAAIEANRVYQEALQRLNQSLDLRKNRTFDPMWMAAAQGFLAPTKTGSFFEALGNVAGGLGEAQKRGIEEQQQEAQQRLNVASAGLELERLKQRDRAIGQYLGEQPTTLGMKPSGGLPGSVPVQPSGGLSGGPSPAAPAGGALPPTQAAQAGALPGPKPAGFEGVSGIQTMPPNPEYLTGRQYISMNRFEKGKSFPDLLKEANDIDQKRFVTKEGGVQDMSSGMFYPFPKGEMAERQIYGSTYKVDAKTAALLDMYSANNDPRYHQLARQAIEGPPREPKPGGAPGEGPTGRVSEEELAARRKEEETRAGKLGEAAAKKESAVKETDQNARRIYGITSRVGNYLDQSKNYFGIFQRPNLMSSIGNFISQGLQTPNGTINLPALQASVTALMPGVKQADLDNVQKAAADLAEAELLFTRLYLSGQGQVTEGERRIVQRIPGGVANSPEVLRSRLDLLKERAQFDMDITAAWDKWEKANPGKSYLKFERSDDFKEIERNYEERLAQMEKRLPALPSQQRAPAKSSNKNLDTARDRLNKALGG